MGDTLLPGKTLPKGQKLVSAGGAASFEMQPDGNAVVYDLRKGARKPLWASNTGGKGASAVMQTDGNLVVYDANHHAVWASGTNGKGPALRAVIQTDGNFVVYDVNHHAVWSTGTNGFQDVRGRGQSKGFFGDIASAVENVYNSIPMPIRAVLAPASVITEVAVAHPEMIPLFGQQASQAKALFNGLTSGNVNPSDAVAIASQALGAAGVAIPPDLAGAVTAAAHMAAAASPLASQAMQIAQAAGQAATAAQVPHPLTLKLAPPPAVHPTVHLQLAAAARAGAPPPVVRVTLPAPKAGAPLAPPAAAEHVQAPHSPGAPAGATYWHCAPLPGGHWQCQWM